VGVPIAALASAPQPVNKLKGLSWVYINV
jgi:hypothetical protein